MKLAYTNRTMAPITSPSEGNASPEAFRFGFLAYLLSSLRRLLLDRLLLLLPPYPLLLPPYPLIVPAAAYPPPPYPPLNGVLLAEGLKEEAGGLYEGRRLWTLLPAGLVKELVRGDG